MKMHNLLLEPELQIDRGQTLEVGVPYIASDSRINPNFCNEKLSIYADGLYESLPQMFANSSRFVEGNAQIPITTYATGWSDPANLKATLDFIAPEVRGPRRFEYFVWTNAEEFLSELNEIRAIGAWFRRVEYTGTRTTSQTDNKGLTIRVDQDAVTDITNWRQVYTQRLIARLLRNDLRRAYALLSASAVSGGTVAWSTTGTPLDPDQQLLTELIAGQTSSGLKPNRIIFNQTAWTKRLQMSRSLATAGGFASAGMTLQQLSSFLGLSGGAAISDERYIPSGGATTKLGIAPADEVIIFNAMDGGMEDPSNLKRFVSPTEGGGLIRVYEQPINAKMIDITVEHYSRIVATTTLGIRKLVVT